MNILFLFFFVFAMYLIHQSVRQFRVNNFEDGNQSTLFQKHIEE